MKTENKAEMKTKLSGITAKIENACEKAGESQIAGMSLEEPSPKLLDVRDGDFDEHVAMQPAAIAYFGAMKKEASRHHDSLKRSYERWYKKRYQEARITLDGAKQTGDGRITKADIEAHVLMNSEDEIVDWENRIESLQEKTDTLDVWYEAWRQKSFSLREHGQAMSDERKTQPYMFGHSEEKDEKTSPSRDKGMSAIERVRKLQRAKKGG